MRPTITRRDVERVAQGFSDDPDTQIGCVITSGASFVSGGNSLPNRIAPTEGRLTRPAKYDWILHAEKVAIGDAARTGLPLLGATLYLNWFPCADCASMMIQAGIKHLVADRGRYESRKDDPRYQFALAMERLVEAEVNISWWEDADAPRH